MGTSEFKKSFWSWFDFLQSMLFDPLLFAFFVFIIFTRLESLMEISKEFPDKTLSDLINADIAMNWLIYFGFLLVFFIWMVGKARQHKQQVRDHRELVDAIKAMHKDIRSIKKDIKKIKSKLGE